MFVEIEMKRMVAAICTNPTLVAELGRCTDDNAIDKAFVKYQSVIDQMLADWKKKAEVASTPAQAPIPAGNTDMSLQQVLEEYIDSVKSLSSSLKEADVEAWLRKDDGSEVVKQIRKEFWDAFKQNPVAASVVLRKNSTKIFIAAGWL